MGNKIKILAGIGGFAILVSMMIFISTFGYAQEEIIENGNELQLLIENHIMPDYLKLRFENFGAIIDYYDGGTQIRFNHGGNVVSKLRFRKVITEYQKKIITLQEESTVESFVLDLPDRCIRYGNNIDQVASFDLTYDSQTQQASFSLRELNDPICL